MRAIRVTNVGGPEAMELVEVDRPEPGQGEVVIDVAAAGVNFIDTYQRGGLYPMDLPLTPGPECAGTIAALGAGVIDFAVGDRVAVAASSGSYAEARLAPASQCIGLPEDLSFEQAAAALLQGMTAHYLAFDTFPLAEGDRCLIHAGAGGTGRLLIQLAKSVGAEVFTTVGTDAKGEIAASAGADHVINYAEKSFADEVRRIAGTEKPLDVVYDGVGAAVFDDSLTLLRKRGLMATFGNASGPVPPIEPLALSRAGSLFLTRPTLFDYVATREELVARATDVFDRIANGSLEVTIGATYPLEEAAQAHQDLEGRKTTGKLLIVP